LDSPVCSFEATKNLLEGTNFYHHQRAGIYSFESEVSIYIVVL